MTHFSSKSPLIIPVAAELKERLRAVSWETRIAMTQLVRDAIIRFLDQRDRQGT